MNKKLRIDRRGAVLALSVALMLVATACGPGDDTTVATDATTTTAAPTTTAAGSTDTTAPPDTETPLEEATIQFWHVYTGPLEEAINELVARFEDEYPMITVEAQFTGGYFPTSQRIAAAIEANELPNVTVAFEDNTVTWARAGVLLDLDSLANDPAEGADLDDFLPVLLARNTYLTEGGQMLSFPWTVAIDALFFNQDMLASVGFDGPATTWDEFLLHCETLLRELSRPCYSIQVDASDFNATGFTFGGFPTIDVEARATNYDKEPWTKTIDLYATLVEEGYGFPTVGRAEEATASLSDFISQQVAYIVTSSRWAPFIEEGVAGSFEWSIGHMPQETAGSDPITVVFGPNSVVFNTNEAENRASWEFVKFLASPASQAFWAETSGNLPSRLSVGDSAEYGAFLAQNPAMATAWEALPFALSELPMTSEGNLGPPPFSFRVLVQDVMAELITGNMTREEAQRTLVEDGATLLAEWYASLLD